MKAGADVGCHAKQVRAAPRDAQRRQPGDGAAPAAGVPLVARAPATLTMRKLMWESKVAISRVLLRGYDGHFLVTACVANRGSLPHALTPVKATTLCTVVP